MICGRLFISLTYQINFTQTFILQLKRNHNNQTIKTPKTRIPKKDESLMITSFFCLILQINFKTNISNQSPQLKLNDTYIESAKKIQTTWPTI